MRSLVLAPFSEAGGMSRMSPESNSHLSPSDERPLSRLEGRVLGCLLEKESSTPDLYPLTLNALVNACNQRSNRSPVMAVSAADVTAAIESLRLKRFASLFSGADARVPKFRHTLDLVRPLDPTARAVLTELLVRGPQTVAELRSRSERLLPGRTAAEFESAIQELANHPGGAWVVLLPRQPGQKEARWGQTLAAEPPPGEGSAEPLTVTATLPPEVEQRLARLEQEIADLRAEMAALRQALGES